MKRKWYRNKENSHYLEFADSHIESLYTTPDGKLALKYLEKKLTKEEYDGLNKIGGFLVFKKAISLKKKLAWNEAEAKTRKIDIAELQKKITEGEASIDAYNNYIIEPAKKEFEHYYTLVEMEEDFEKEFTDYFGKFDKKQFLQVVAKTLCLLAVFKTEKTFHQLANLQKSWQAEFKQTIKKIKNRRKGVQAKELLRIILGNKIEDIEAIRKEEEKDIEKYGKRLFDISINLDEELDLDKLHWGDYSIKTMKLYSPEMPQIIEDHDKTIDITINKIPETFSLEEYYELKINTISSEMLRNSKDLLDNILIIYTIKRAQNGDEKAVKVLFNCYEDSAEGLAVKFIKQRVENLNTKFFNPNGQISIESAKAIVRDILELLLRGDRPSLLYKSLDKTKEDKPDVGMLLHRRIYDILMESYNGGYMALITTIKTIYSQNLIFKRQMSNINYQMNKAIESQKESIELEYLAKIFSLSLHQINWVSMNTLTATAMLTPYNSAVYSPSFNKAVFKPSKKCNLTTWLFGSKKFPEESRGMLWQKLYDWYRASTYTEKGKRLVKPDDFRRLIDPAIIEYKMAKKNRRNFDGDLEDMERQRKNWSI